MDYILLNSMRERVQLRDPLGSQRYENPATQTACRQTVQYAKFKLSGEISCYCDGHQSLHGNLLVVGLLPQPSLSHQRMSETSRWMSRP